MLNSSRCVAVIAFNFEELLQASDQAVLDRFQLVRRVSPTLVPQDFEADACQITRAPEAITLHFYRRGTSEELGTEIFRFSFQPAGRRES